jgi:hypothetical protein
VVVGSGNNKITLTVDLKATVSLLNPGGTPAAPSLNDVFKAAAAATAGASFLGIILWGAGQVANWFQNDCGDGACLAG